AHPPAREAAMALYVSVCANMTEVGGKASPWPSLYCTLLVTVILENLEQFGSALFGFLHSLRVLAVLQQRCLKFERGLGHRHPLLGVLRRQGPRSVAI